MLICPPSGLYPPFSGPLMSRGKPFETHPGLFPHLPHHHAAASHLSPLFSSHLQPSLHNNPYFALPNPFLQPPAGQKTSPLLPGVKGTLGPVPPYSHLTDTASDSTKASPDKKSVSSRSPTPHNLSILSTSELSGRSKDLELDVLDSSSKEGRPSSTGAMSSGSVDEELEDESMEETVEDDEDIAEAEDLSLKSPTKSEATNSSSSNQSPASNSLIGELMSKFGFNDIQEYQVS